MPSVLAIDNLTLHHLAVLFCNTFLEHRKPCPIALVFFLGKSSVVTIGGSSLWAKYFLTFRLMTIGHIAVC